MISLNWVGLIACVVGFLCFGLIGFKRSAWWGPAKSVMGELDSTEIGFVKVGFISLLVGIVFFILANI